MKDFPFFVYHVHQKSCKPLIRNSTGKGYSGTVSDHILFMDLEAISLTPVPQRSSRMI